MSADQTAYQVLARKYRPLGFEDLIGQEAMVRTLRNAFAADRIAHAFVLTGVRGVGKTTTARIIARGLNCVGPDGANGPTVAPCGECAPCRDIAAGRCMDVIEVDAASHTGVDFVRDLNEMVRYKPAETRFKVIILDEAHMLSTAAFNALLKTLEEPPPHVKFFFATTEIRKMPVTVLSRCQRFDLRRIESERLIAFLGEISAKEGAAVSEEALALIARAAEGSARDALSLLDQAIAHGGAGDGATAETVRAMLGLADRARGLDLFEKIMAGDAAGALAELGGQYAEGADPAAILRELAELAHWISVLKISPEIGDDPTVAPAARARGRSIAERLAMRSLSRAWQMLLKALAELDAAPNAMMAAEMAVIRLTHVADLPSPEDLVRRLSAESAAQPAASPQGGGSGGGGPRAAASGGGPRLAAAVSVPAPASAAAAARDPAERAARPAAMEAPIRAEAAPVAPPDAEAPESLARFQSFEDVVALAREKGDGAFAVSLETFIRVSAFAPGRLSFAPTENAPSGLAGELTRKLAEWTGARWMVSVSKGTEAQTLAERAMEEAAALRERAARQPLVAAALAAFPGATVALVRPFGAEAPLDPADDATVETSADYEYDVAYDDDWEPVDPFDEE